MTISQSVAICNSSNKSNRRLYDHLYKDLAYVSRANDTTKLISPKARIILANLVMMISRNGESEEFIDHNFLSSLTHCSSSKQNANILSQLADIIDYQYHCCIIFQGKRRVFGYVVKFTLDGEQRIRNPRLFYGLDISSTTKINFGSNENKSRVQSKKISTPYISNKYYTNNNLKNNRSRSSKSDFNKNEELEDLEHEIVTQESVKNFGSDLASPVKSTTINHQRVRKSLSEFYPISEEDARVLCQSSDRKFTLDDVNSLILKLSKKKPNHGFFTKELFMNYMKQALVNELEQVEEQTTTGYSPAISFRVEAPVIDQTTPWGKIRAALCDHYGKMGNALDKAWFGQLVPVEGADSSNLVLKAPTNFICDYIEQHYLHTIQRLCSAQKYSFSLTV